jgi:thiazole/oxazole-forming peptide maturase SagC family component
MNNQEFNKELPKKPCICRQFFVVPISPDEVQIREGALWGEIHSLHDKEKAGKLAQVLELLDGTHSVDEITNITSVEEKDLFDILNYMNNNNLLEAESLKIESINVEDVYTSSSISNRYFKIWNTFSSKLKGAKITVIGAGIIGSRLIFQLVALGIKNIVIADNSVINEKNYSRISHCCEKDNGMLTREMIKNKINTLDASINVVSTGYELSEHYIKELTNNSDLVVVSEDIYSPLLLTTMNKVALKSNIVWSMLCIDGLEGVVGPTIIPHETACYTCYELRLRSNLLNKNAYDKFKIFQMDKNNKNPLNYNLHINPSFADLIVSIFTMDIPEIISIKSGFTIGRSYAVGLNYFHIESEDILKIPRCPDCSKISQTRSNVKLFNIIRNIEKESSKDEGK